MSELLFKLDENNREYFSRICKLQEAKSRQVKRLITNIKGEKQIMDDRYFHPNGSSIRLDLARDLGSPNSKPSYDPSKQYFNITQGTNDDDSTNLYDIDISGASGVAGC
jgi:hypothetical protein